MNVHLWAEAGAIFPSTCKGFANKSCRMEDGTASWAPILRNGGAPASYYSRALGIGWGPLGLEDPSISGFSSSLISSLLAPHLPTFLQVPVSLSLVLSPSRSHHSSVSPQATRHDTRAHENFPSPTPAEHPPDGQTLDKACSLHCNTGNSWQQALRPIWDRAHWACVPLAAHCLPPLGGLGRPLSLCLVWG